MGGKVEYRKLSNRQRSILKKELFDTFKKLGIGDESALLLYDLLMRSEVIMLSRRILIARELFKGHTREYIKNKLRVGLDTIRSVDSWLEVRFPDYHQIISPLFEKNNKKNIKITDLPKTISPMKKKLLSALLKIE